MEIENINNFKEIFKAGKWKVFGIGGLPETRSEAHFVVDDFELICSNQTSELSSVRKVIKTKVFDIKNKSKKAEDIFSDEKVLEYIKTSSAGKNIAIYLFRSSPTIEKICKENGWSLVAEKSILFDRIDSRNFFFELLKELDSSRDFEILWSDQLSGKINELFKRFGEKIVIQTFNSAGGRGTFFLEKNIDNEKLERINFDKNQKIIVTSFVQGFEIAITGCVTSKNGILSGWVRHQFVGLEAIVSGKEHGGQSFCGNDWKIDTEYSDDIQKQGEDLVQKIGTILRREKFRGIFGIDFIYNKYNKKLIPLEINPRLIGSFPVETQFEVLNETLPLVGFHFLEFLNINYEIGEDLRSRSRKKLTRECSHVLIANFFKRDIVFKKSLRGGVYQLKNSRLEFVRDGFQISDIKSLKVEFVLSAGVPFSGKHYKKNNQLLRIIWGKSIEIKNGRDINVDAKNIINVLREELKMLIEN